MDLDQLQAAGVLTVANLLALAESLGCPPASLLSDQPRLDP